MYDVLQSFSYNEFIKQERKTRKISTLELSKHVHLSTGTISNIENSEDILNNVNLKYILNYFNYTNEYLIIFDSKISDLIHNYIQSVIFIEDKKVDFYFDGIKKISKNEHNLILQLPYKLCEFIHYMYYSKTVDISIIQHLINNSLYFTDKYQSILNMYLGKYYELNRDYSSSKNFFNKSLFNINRDPTYKAMFHFFISNMYSVQKDTQHFFKHQEIAVNLFGKSRNYRRITNIDINLGTHYIYLGDYKKSLSYYEEALSQAKQHRYLPEEYIILQNISFVYMLQGKYFEVIECYRQIPTNQLNKGRCHSYMISLTNIGEIDMAKQICELGLGLGVNLYYDYFFKMYLNYFKSQDLLLLVKGIEKILNSDKYKISILETRFIHILLSYYYQKLARYKKANEHLQAYIHLLTN